MKVIRHGAGWDIAFDVIFSDKQTADMIARRIAPLLPTLIRDAVDTHMRVASPQTTLLQEKLPHVSSKTEDEAAEGHHAREHGTGEENTAELNSVSPSLTPSIASRVRALGI